MSVVFSTNEFNGAIIYWIDLTEMMNNLNDMVERSDELGEKHEYENWVKDDQDGEELSVMDLHVMIENAYNKASELQSVAEVRLKELLLAGIEIGDRKFTEYPIGKVDWNDEIESLIEYLLECFEDIFAHDHKACLDNFYKVLNEGLRLACEGEL